MKNWTIIEVADDFDMPEDFQNTRKQRFHTEYVSKWLSHWVGYPDESVFDVNVLSINENINFRKLSQDLCTMWLASITEGNSMCLNPLDLTALKILSDIFFDFIDKIFLWKCTLIIFSFNRKEIL